MKTLLPRESDVSDALIEPIDQDRTESSQRCFLKPFQCFCQQSTNHSDGDHLDHHQDAEAKEMNETQKQSSQRQEQLEQALIDIIDKAPVRQESNATSRRMSGVVQKSQASSLPRLPATILSMDVVPYDGLDIDYFSSCSGSSSTSETLSETLGCTRDKYQIYDGEDYENDLPRTVDSPVSDYLVSDDRMLELSFSPQAQIEEEVEVCDDYFSPTFDNPVAGDVSLVEPAAEAAHSPQLPIEKEDNRIVDPSLAEELAVHLKMLEDIEFTFEEQDEFKTILRRISELSARIKRGEVKFAPDEHKDIKTILKRIAESSEQHQQDEKLRDESGRPPHMIETLPNRSLSLQETGSKLECESKEEAEVIGEREHDTNSIQPVMEKSCKEENELRISLTTQSFSTPANLSVASSVTSFSSVVSFRDLIGDERVATLTTANLNKSLQCHRLTPHTFFWRSHPSVTVTSQHPMHSFGGKGKATYKVLGSSGYVEKDNKCEREKTHIDPTFVRQALQLRQSCLCQPRLQERNTKNLTSATSTQLSTSTGSSTEDPLSRDVYDNVWVEF